MSEIVTLGDCTLIRADCREVLPTLGRFDAVITDPPYSARTHAGHDATARGHQGEGNDGAERSGLGYEPMTPEGVDWLSAEYTRLCNGWIVWMTDHTLAPTIGKALELRGRYVFAPLPFFAPGSRVRLSGDGPSSWTDWIIVARTAKQSKWGTLPGGYVAGPGWNDKARMGGKPTLLMDALVADYSRIGDRVLDSHMGAGTTGVACVKAGRRFVGCEIDREAFDIACERISRAQAQGQLIPHEQPQPKQEALI